MCVVCGPGSKADAQPRNEVRSVASAVPSCQRRRKASNTFAGSRFPAQSRQRQPSFLTPRRQSVGRGLRRDGNMGALGRPARSLPPWCQTNLVLPVSSAVSVRRNAACEMEAVRKWPISRLLPRLSATGGASRRNAVSCPCEASRAIADVLAGRSRAAILPVLADMRSIAASGIFGRTAVFDGLGSLRPSERMERKCSLRNCSEMEWSGCKVMSPASGAAEACRYLARGTSASVGSVTPGEFLRRLRDGSTPAATSR